MKHLTNTPEPKAPSTGKAKPKTHRQKGGLIRAMRVAPTHYVMMQGDEILALLWLCLAVPGPLRLKVPLVRGMVACAACVQGLAWRVCLCCVPGRLL